MLITARIDRRTAPSSDDGHGPPVSRIPIVPRRAPNGSESLSAAGCGLRARRQRLAHRLELDPVEHVLEEAADDQPLGLGAREAAGHRVEELLAVDLAERRAVRAADVVGEDLEAGDRVGVRLRRRAAGCGSPGRRSSSARRCSTRIIPRQTAVASSRSAPLKAKSEVVFGAMCSWNVS